MFTWQVRLSSVLFTMLIAGLTGCATPVSTNITPTAGHIAKYNDLPDLAIVTTLEKNVNDAKAANMPFLAPHYFLEASQILSESQNSLGKKPRDVLVSNAAKGDAILEKGRAVMAIVQYRFAKELEYKAQLDEHNAAKLLPKEYEHVIGNLSDLIEKIEREQPDNIDKDKDALSKAMLDLVIKAVQEGALREAEVINTDNKKQNADRQSPVTYAEALRVYQDAKTQIAAAHHDKQLVQRLGAQALFAARHAQQVNERVALLQSQLKPNTGGGVSFGAAAGAASGGTGALVGAQVGGNKASGGEKAPEEKIVLEEEARLLGISIALGLKDQRDQPLDKQVEEIRRAASEISHQQKTDANVGHTQDLEARLKVANDETKQVQAQLLEKDKQLEVQSAQLANKDEQIKNLNDRIAKLESETKPSPKHKAAKPKKQ